MTDQITEVYAQYYAATEMVKADLAWRNGSSDVISVKRDDEITYAPGTIKGKPAFEDGVLESLGMPPFKTWRREGGTLVAQSKNWSAIIPGGFRDGATPNKMNPISFECGGYSALMGLVHVIAIPNQRLTNCVQVMEGDVPLIMEGIELLQTAFDVLVKGGADEIGSVRWQLSQSGEIQMKDGSVTSAKVQSTDFIDGDKFGRLLDPASSQSEFDEMKMEVTVHADTMSSIRKLHLHGFSSDFKTVAYQKMEEKAQESGLRKNTPIEEVIYMANSAKAKEMLDKVLMPPPSPQVWSGSDGGSGLSRQSSMATVRAATRVAGPGWNDDSGLFSRSV